MSSDLLIDSFEDISSNQEDQKAKSNDDEVNKELNVNHYLINIINLNLKF